MEPIRAGLANAHQAHEFIMQLWTTIKPWLVAGHRLHIEVQPEKRSNEQNAAQWPILQAFADQLLWPVNGRMEKMTKEEWKDVLTSAFRQEQPRLAMGLNGGVVMLGQRTSKFSKAEFSAWLEFLHATAADRDVNLSYQEPWPGQSADEQTSRHQAAPALHAG